MPKFTAPVDVTAVSLNAGQFTVIDGFLTIDSDIGEGDRIGLAANGFVPYGEPAAAPVSPKPPKTNDTQA